MREKKKLSGEDGDRKIQKQLEEAALSNLYTEI